MTRKVILFLILTSFLLLASHTLAQDADNTAVWQATYFDNRTLEGDAVLTRTETAIDYRWGLDSPDEALPADYFSARWTTTLTLPEGRYRFQATVDDGIRVWVDNLLLINSWRVQSPRTLQGEIELDGGEVPVRVEYFEETERALIDFSWTPLQLESATWYAEFFANRTLSGSPTLVRNDPSITYNWGASSPAPDVFDPEAFSARWRRTIDVEPGLYLFRITVDDGARLWVDNQLLIDAWQAQPLTTYEEQIALSGNNIPVRLEYFENGGQAAIALEWSRLVTETPTPAPTATPPPAADTPGPPAEPGQVVIVDNDSENFVRGGSPAENWSEAEGGYQGTFLWTDNSDRLPSSYNWAQWRPNLVPGQYEVSVFIPQQSGTTVQARYWVSYDDGFSLRVVNQAANGGRWVSLGTFTFSGGDDYVSLSDLTLEEANSTRVAYDALRWTPVTASSPGEAALSITPRRAAPGEQITIFASGFPAGQTVTLAAGPPGTEPLGQYGEVETGSDGTLRFTLTMPQNWPDGSPIAPTLGPEQQMVFLLRAEDGTRASATVTYLPGE
jgi:hypothetical protein